MNEWVNSSFFSSPRQQLQRKIHRQALQRAPGEADIGSNGKSASHFGVTEMEAQLCRFTPVYCDWAPWCWWWEEQGREHLVPRVWLKNLATHIGIWTEILVPEDATFISSFTLTSTRASLLLSYVLAPSLPQCWYTIVSNSGVAQFQLWKTLRGKPVDGNAFAPSNSCHPALQIIFS